MLTFLGDVHGKFNQIPYHQLGTGLTVCVGDLGIGFPNQDPPVIPAHFRFIRGNHDNPEVCRQHPNYLGEYGFLQNPDLFFVGGADSIDKSHRTPGGDWWPD